MAKLTWRCFVRYSFNGELKLFKVRTFGDPVLREKTRPVEKITPEIKSLIHEMTKTMYEQKGVGLAATQIGVIDRIAVIDPGDNLRVLINPEIVWKNKKKVVEEEGCLSLPSVTVKVPRWEKIKVRYQDENGKVVELTAEGLLARIIQHELDHLNGCLIIDRANEEEKKRALEVLSSYLLRTDFSFNRTPSF